MEITLKPSALCGTVEAPPSKSAAHRILICAASAGGETAIRCPSVSKDIGATIACLRALGCHITAEGEYITVKTGFSGSEKASLDCDESGSTLRFMLPLAAALGRNSLFTGRGRLAERPIKPLCDALSARGVRLSSDKLPLEISGSLTCGSFEIEADISSQFISGLLLALPLCGGDSEIVLKGRAVSAPYIDITTDIQKKFGVSPKKTPLGFKVKSERYISPRQIAVEGDWSNAAFWLTAGVIGSGSICCTNLSADTKQGDRKIIGVLRAMGAKLIETENSVTAEPSELRAAEIDCEDIPDLVPVLTVAACRAVGKTVFRNTARLREKESDRVESTMQMIRSLGGNISAGENYIEVEGIGSLKGGTVDSFGDHRIAMSGAIASVICVGNVTVCGAEAVNKSYPGFFEEFCNLGGGMEK